MQRWPVKHISNTTLTIILHQSVILDYLLQKPPPCSAPSSDSNVVHYNQRNRNINRGFWQNYIPKSFFVKAWNTPDLFSGLILKINSLNHCGTGTNATTPPGWIQKSWKKINTQKRNYSCRHNHFKLPNLTIILTFYLDSPHSHKMHFSTHNKSVLQPREGDTKHCQNPSASTCGQGLHWKSQNGSFPFCRSPNVSPSPQGSSSLYFSSILSWKN